MTIIRVPEYPALKKIMSNPKIDISLRVFGAAANCNEAVIATDPPYIAMEAFVMSSGMRNIIWFALPGINVILE